MVETTSCYRPATVQCVGWQLCSASAQLICLHVSYRMSEKVRQITPPAYMTTNLRIIIIIIIMMMLSARVISSAAGSGVVCMSECPLTSFLFIHRSLVPQLIRLHTSNIHILYCLSVTHYWQACNH